MPTRPSVARRRVALTDASRRFAMVRPSLTAGRRLAPRTAGRDGDPAEVVLSGIASGRDLQFVRR